MKETRYLGENTFQAPLMGDWKITVGDYEIAATIGDIVIGYGKDRPIVRKWAKEMGLEIFEEEEG